MVIVPHQTLNVSLSNQDSAPPAHSGSAPQSGSPGGTKNNASSPKTPSLPLEILFTIASYVPRNPVIFCRIATVSKQFYYVFTSDRLWRYLDIYNVQTGIFPDFLRRSKDTLPAVRIAWDTYSDANAPFLQPWTPFPRAFDKFISLAMLANFRGDELVAAHVPQLIEDTHLYRIVVGGLNKSAALLASPECLEQCEDVTEAALMEVPLLFEVLPTSLLLKNKHWIIRFFDTWTQEERNISTLDIRLPEQIYRDTELMWQIAEYDGASLSLFRDIDTINPDHDMSRLVMFRCAFYTGLRKELSPGEFNAVWRRDVGLLYSDTDLFVKGLPYCPAMLKWAPEAVTDNFELVKGLVTTLPHVYAYASERLRADHDLAMVAVHLSTWNIEHMADNLWADKELFSSIDMFKLGLTLERFNYDTLPEAVWDIPQIVYHAVCQFDGYFDRATPEVKDNKDFVLKILQSAPHKLQSVSDRLKDDEEVAMVAATNGGPGMLIYASDRVQQKIIHGTSGDGSRMVSGLYSVSETIDDMELDDGSTDETSSSPQPEEPSRPISLALNIDHFELEDETQYHHAPSIDSDDEALV